MFSLGNVHLGKRVLGKGGLGKRGLGKSCSTLNEEFEDLTNSEMARRTHPRKKYTQPTMSSLLKSKTTYARGHPNQKQFNKDLVTMFIHDALAFDFSDSKGFPILRVI